MEKIKDKTDNLEINENKQWQQKEKWNLSAEPNTQTNQ